MVPVEAENGGQLGQLGGVILTPVGTLLDGVLISAYGCPGTLRWKVPTADGDRNRDNGRRPQSICRNCIPERGGRDVSVSIKPLEDRILVLPLDAEQTTASGLVIPDTAKEKPQEGQVVAVGPGRFDDEGENRIPVDISVGDTVIYSKYGGTEVKYNNEEYLILSARDVLAIVEK